MKYSFLQFPLFDYYLFIYFFTYMSYTDCNSSQRYGSDESFLLKGLDFREKIRVCKENDKSFGILKITKERFSHKWRMKKSSDSPLM